MAKIKVHELAKELDRQSREVIAFLQDKGVEVKVAQSVVEEADAEMVRRELGAAAAGKKAAAEKSAAPKEAAEKEPAKGTATNHAKETAKSAEKAAAEETVKKAEKAAAEGAGKEPIKAAAEGTGKESAKAAAEGAGKEAAKNAAEGAGKESAKAAAQNGGKEAAKAAAKEPEKAAAKDTGKAPGKEAGKRPAGEGQKTGPVKKKRNIIFVSNPHNSKMPGAQRSSAGGQGRRGGMNNGSGLNRPLIRPLTPPSPTPSVGQIKPTNPPRQKKVQEQGRAPQEAASQKAPAQAMRQQGGEGRTEKRPQERTGGNYDQRNRQTDSRQGANRFHKDTAAVSGGVGRGRNHNDSGRPERSAGREDNKFRKQGGAKSFVPESPIKDTEKHRDDEKRRMNQERDRRSRKDAIYEDGGGKNRNKPGRFIKPEKKPEEKQEEQIKTLTLPETLTVKELADKMRIQPSVIVKKLFLQGQAVTVNQEISFETAEEIALEYDIICEKEVKVDVIEELLREEEDDKDSMTKRPPVICVMGHVDHGKTSLLDAIRKTNVTDKEAGGITQHIGAYTVNINNEKITFLDTPGHEAFTAMRMRGANATDIAILVVAADDGVMPQTVEAINHAKAAGIEIIVAVNKIDKPNANIDRVKQEMTEYDLIPVDWGGSTEFVPVSAKSGEGIETLLETILLTAEILELKANAKRRARGLVIEAELDRGRGPVATVLVQKGTLHVGDFVSAGASHGKVRAMIDDKGRRVKEAGPSTPVEILGLSDVPNAGEIFIAHENDKTAKSYADTYLAQNKEKKLEETRSRMSLDDLFTQIQAGNLKELNLIVKADVQGSVEAVKQSLLKLSNEEIVVKCIHGGVGAINESDVILASASNAIIIGFNVRPDATAKAVAEREGVDIRLYKVIYQAIEDVEAAMKGMLDPVYEEKVIGHAEVRQLFRASAVGNIAGAYVLDGVFQKGCKVRISREGEQIFEGNLASLKRFKDDVKEVKAGYECGLVFEGFDQMQELDIVESYIMVEVPR